MRSLSACPRSPRRSSCTSTGRGMDQRRRPRLPVLDILPRPKAGDSSRSRPLGGKQLRFAVHRPGIPDASPRSHGVPRRDIPGRVHISVAGVSAGSAREARLTLARLRIHFPARRAALASKRRTDLLHPAGRFVLQPAHQQAPARPQDLPVEPGLGPHVPARVPAVPRPDRVMLLIFRSSTRITSKRRAMSVLAFSAQSLRLSVSLVRSRAMVRSTRPRRFDPRRARASLRCRRRTRRCSRQVRPGACSSSPVDSAALTATPRSMPTAWPLPGAGTGAGDHGEGEVPASGAKILTR